MNPPAKRKRQTGGGESAPGDEGPEDAVISGSSRIDWTYEMTDFMLVLVEQQLRNTGADKSLKGIFL
jgi:hypothetical protein